MAGAGSGRDQCGMGVGSGGGGMAGKMWLGPRRVHRGGEWPGAERLERVVGWKGWDFCRAELVRAGWPSGDRRRRAYLG